LELYLKKAIGKTFRVEIENRLANCLKDGHREFGVPGNVILQKKTLKQTFDCLSLNSFFPHHMK